MRTRKSRRELQEALSPLGFSYDGKTAGNHLRWIHSPSGRLLVSVAETGNRRAVNNTVRSAKILLRKINENPSA